jgi:hypothetical protein
VTGVEKEPLPTNFLALIIISKIAREASPSNGKTLAAKGEGRKGGNNGVITRKQGGMQEQGEIIAK